MQFWFDFASPYSHLSAHRIAEMADSAGISLEWKVFLLGPIFRKQGWNDSPFNLNPLRGKYMWRDVERLGEKFGIPFRKPSRFPRNSVLPARVTCLVAPESWGPDFVRAVFRANFAEDRDISDPEVVGAVLASVGQSPGWIDKALWPENKGCLRRQTEEAERLDIFGAPTFRVGDELFWGNDRLEDALAWATSRAPSVGSSKKAPPAAR